MGWQVTRGRARAWDSGGPGGSASYHHPTPTQWKVVFGAGSTGLYLNHRQTKATLHTKQKKTGWE